MFSSLVKKYKIVSEDEKIVRSLVLNENIAFFKNEWPFKKISALDNESARIVQH